MKEAWCWLEREGDKQDGQEARGEEGARGEVNTKRRKNHPEPPQKKEGGGGEGLGQRVEATDWKKTRLEKKKKSRGKGKGKRSVENCKIKCRSGWERRDLD